MITELASRISNDENFADLPPIEVVTPKKEVAPDQIPTGADDGELTEIEVMSRNADDVPNDELNEPNGSEINFQRMSP